MATEPQNTSNNLVNSFNKGMVKDPNSTFSGEGVWTHARNAVNNSHDGELGVLGNEPANLHCVTLPYDLIGAIHIGDEEWAVFTTDDTNSEIGIFNEGTCTYQKVINDPCLNFKRTHLITGASRKKADCGRLVYWADGLNPDRYMDLDNVPYWCYEKTAAVVPSQVPDVYSYTVQNNVVPVSVINATMKLRCSDEGCTVQGDIKATITLDQPAPAGGLKILLGRVWTSAGLGRTAVGMQIFPLPPNTTPDPYYPDNDVPFEVVIPEGQTSITTSSVIRQQGKTGPSEIFICHSCLWPISDMYVKSGTPGVYLKMSSTDPYTVHNMDVIDRSGEQVTFSYRDVNNASIGPVTLNPGEAKTVCAKEDTVTVSSAANTSITKGNSCAPEPPKPEPGCAETICTDALDCEKIRLTPLVTAPCLSLQKGTASGTLMNGSYQVVVAYTIDGIRVTDYFMPSNVQSLFSHHNLSGSLELHVTQIDTDFDEFELVVISHANQQTVAKRLGIYSTRQKTVYIDTIDPSLPTIPLNLVSLRTPAYERSDALFQVNNYLLRSGIYSKFAFNYQQQANQIRAKWVAVKYPSDYYQKGGNNVSYMRDEQYAFFIRWVYNTGEKSASFHIPGRPAKTGEKQYVFGSDAIETLNGETPQRWQVENTATITSLKQTALPDGGVQVAEGEMGYWQSTEQYPDNKPEIWGELCGKHIRHHKFPDNTLSEQVNHFTDEGRSIVVMGVKFEGITHPLDNDGNPITSIVGYEILRGSREGQKTVVAKGILNNMREYEVPGGTGGVKGLYQNFPYNDLRPDYYHTATDHMIKNGGDNDKRDPLEGYRKDIFSFHSPETTFNRPYIGTGELKVYQELNGTVTGSFDRVYKHPRFKILNDRAGTIAGVIAMAIGVTTLLGKGGISIGGTGDMPIRSDIAGGKMNLPAVGGAAGIGTTAVNTALILAQIAIDVAILSQTSFMMADQIIKILNSLARNEDYALQYQSHGFYDKGITKVEGERRRAIVNASYVKDNIQSFDAAYRVNNLYRGNYVLLKLSSEISDPSVQDNSRVLIDDSTSSKAVNKEFQTTTSTQYAAMKINLPSQYGQLEAIKQIPTGSCVHATVAEKSRKFTSSVIFGGDTYINRFTEKNTMFFFTDWLHGHPDEYEYDYSRYINIPYPRFFLNSEQEGFEDLKLKFQSPIDIDFTPPSIKLRSPIKIELAHKKRSLNRIGKDGEIVTRNAYFYLFNAGVRDFFVESEINLAQRDWEEDLGKRHYDPYDFTDVQSMFRSDVIKSGNYYKYDPSLSVSRLYHNYFSWGEILPRDYDPEVAETCFTYEESKVLYSLPQQDELKKDNWRVFLVNNYKDFGNKVTIIKPVNKTGALILFQNASPVQFMGVDTLQTDAGTKITIGDGGLFQQPLQQIMNADTSYQYGACQSRGSVIGTPHGVFWVSQEQGKIFHFAGGVNDLTRSGNKWWFSHYLPSVLQQTYPDYDLYDNPVAGTGVQAVYDNTNEIVYFTKKDYRPLKDNIKYDVEKKQFYYALYDGDTEVRNYVALTDKEYFEDLSWTISYDPKNQMWISLHDWHPSFVLPAKNHFLTTKGASLWRHNVRTDLYCNFYGIDYPFEVEFALATGQNVTTIRSVEYVLECYQYALNGRDRHHILDANFDHAIVFNSEQVSGVLNLHLKGKNNPAELLKFPKVGTNAIDIHYSKEENKYRFNQFWDIAKDRGEFSGSRVPMFSTKGNGYTRSINPKYIDYRKSAMQRKKFRHYSNQLFLRKIKSGSMKMLLKLNNTKILQSPR